MHISFRGSAFGLVAAMAIAAAYAAWHPSAPARSARLAAPNIAEGVGRPFAPPENPICDITTCAEPVGAGSAGICLACGDATDLSLSEFEQSTPGTPAPAFIASRIEPFGLDLDDESSLYFASFQPYAVAAPASEISTAAMVTLGLAAVGWAARKTRRAVLKPRAEPSIC